MRKESIYPEQFSSTKRYENILNLDKMPVFISGNSLNKLNSEDNLELFDVQSLPKILSYGKHYFNLIVSNFENQQYNFKPNSKILFEFKSKNGVVLRSGVDGSVNQRNGIIRCFVEVLEDPLTSRKEIADGIGSLYVVGILDGENIPTYWKNKYNYKCSFKIDIRKNLINADSPKITNASHTLKTTNGAFSFAKNNISPRGTDSFAYSGTTGAPLTHGTPGGGAITD